MAEAAFHYIGAESFGTPKSDAFVDVVFVHGLGGNPYSTWSSTGNDESFWPRWLAKDIPNANVWTAGYDSGPFVSALAGEGGSLEDRATSLLDFLVSHALGQRPIVFVTHSLGGLIIKQMLRVCADSVNTTYKAFLNATRAIVFCGTPHQGAALAAAIKNILKHLASKHVKELAIGDDALLNLNSWFRNWACDRNADIRAYHEMRKSFGVMIVQKASADPGIPGCVPISIDADHITMCKPATHDSQLYLAVKMLVDSYAKESVTPGRSTEAWDLGNSLPIPRATQNLPALFSSATPTSPPAITSVLTPPVTPVPASIGSDTSPTESSKSELLVDYEYFTTQAPHDRRPLAEKLEFAGRTYEVRDAQRKKERFAMALRRHSSQASSLARFTRLMSEVESRFNRHVRPAIENELDETHVNQLVQDAIINPVMEAQLIETDDVTATLVESALYYLTGNCHVRWDADKN